MDSFELSLFDAKLKARPTEIRWSPQFDLLWRHNTKLNNKLRCVIDHDPVLTSGLETYNAQANMRMRIRKIANSFDVRKYGKTMLQKLIFPIYFRILFILLVTIGSTQNAQAVPAGTEMHAGDYVKGISVEFPVLGNQWNLMRFTLENPNDREVDLHVAIYFDVDPTLQYGRRIQIPPLTRIRVWMPIRTPDPKHIVARSFPYRILVRSLGDSTGLLRNEDGSLQLEHTLQIESDEKATGIIHRFPPRRMLDTVLVDDPEVSSLDLMQTGRYQQRLRRNWRTLNRGFAASGELGLDGLAQLIVSDNQLLEDPEGLEAVRRWLNSGGKLWVMLDKVDSQLLEMLLGDIYQGRELESVELSSLDFLDPKGVSIEHRELDVPVIMKRILIDSVEVDYSVDGWPAAFWIDCGRGKVLVTTVGANAWLRPRTSDDRKSRAGEGWDTGQVALDPLVNISTKFFSPPTFLNSALPLFTDQIHQFIGYRIPTRQSVVGILLTYSLLTFLIAAVLWRKKRMVLFGVLGPLMAITAGGAITLVRPASQNMPSLAVSAEIVTPIPGTDDFRSEGIVGLYSADSSVTQLSGSSGGWVLPDLTSYPGGIRSLNYSGPMNWEWDGLRSTPGFRIGKFYQSGQSGRAEAIATFDEQGITGQLQLPEKLKPEDAILITQQGRIGVKLTDDYHFTAHLNDTLSDGQYLAAKLMGDEQRRRSEIVKLLSTDSNKPWNSKQPQLLLWTKPWGLSFDFGENIQQQGNALVVMPIRFERPSAGSQFIIPAAIIDYREVIGPDEHPFGGIYANYKREWLEKKGHSQSWLSFQIPHALLPIKPSRVHIEIDVSGPVGQLELSGWNGTSRMKLKSWDQPVGKLKGTLGDASSLWITPKGQLLLFLSAGVNNNEVNPDRLITTPRWKIESLNLSLEANIPAEPATQN